MTVIYHATTISGRLVLAMCTILVNVVKLLKHFSISKSTYCTTEKTPLQEEKLFFLFRNDWDNVRMVTTNTELRHIKIIQNYICIKVSLLFYAVNRIWCLFSGLYNTLPCIF